MGNNNRFSLNAAAYLVLIKNEEILLLRRFNTGWEDGKHTLISGHIDGDETIAQAMSREAFEEAGIKIDPADLKVVHTMHRKSNTEYIDFFLIPSTWKGTPEIKERDKSDEIKWFRRHPIMTGLLILVVIGIIGSASGGNKTSTTSSGNSTSAGSDQAKVAKVGDAVTDDDLSFTVVTVEKAKTVGNSYTQKNAQGMFYVVSLKLENTGKKTVTFDSSMAKVVDSEGREFERSIEGQTAKGMSEGSVDLFLQQIQPSLSYTGDLVFDLPETIKDPTLVVKGSVFSKGAKIKLQ